MKWLRQYRERLNRTRLRGRLPHALLISGQEGIGKRVLATQLAHSLLCEQPGADGQPCGQCAACGSRKDLQYDYILAISEGGNNTLDNLQLLCKTCDREKSVK